MAFLNKRTAGYRRMSFGLACVLAIVLLFITGMTYRHIDGTLRRVVKSPINLPVPLKAFPYHIEDWEGKDVPIPVAIQRVARNDDFVSRVYINQRTGKWVNLYIAFSARPRTMLGHRPQICYPASGWQHESTEHIRITRQSGLIAPCLLHRFSMPAPSYDKTVVLNYYILNGVIIDKESGFSGLSGRSPNIQGHLANYVAQVQINATLENSVLLAAEEFTDLILDYFPDTRGIVKAAGAN